MTEPMFYLFLYFHFPLQVLAPRRCSINIFEWINKCVNVVNERIDNIKVTFQTQQIMLEAVLHISCNRKHF